MDKPKWIETKIFAVPTETGHNFIELLKHKKQLRKTKLCLLEYGDQPKVVEFTGILLIQSF